MTKSGKPVLFPVTDGSAVTVWVTEDPSGIRKVVGYLERRGYKFPIEKGHPYPSIDRVRFGDREVGHVTITASDAPGFFRWLERVSAAAEVAADAEAFFRATMEVGPGALPLADTAASRPLEAPTDTKAAAASAKPRPSLVPAEALRGAIAALDLGAAKYGAGNWREIPQAEFARLYRDAFLRHVIAAWAGEPIDADSGNPHLDHALACLLLLRARGVVTLQGRGDK